MQALREMQPPETVSEVKSLLGMAQHSSQFIPNHAELTTPLRELTHQGEKWKWTTAEEKSFNALKIALSEDATLSCFETGLLTKLTVDAGQRRLGLILFQKKSKQLETSLVCK